MKQVNTKGEQINIRTTVRAVVTPAAISNTVGNFPVDPFPPSFKFVPPQVGARALPIAAADNEVMPASNGTGLYYRDPGRVLMLWIKDLGKFYPAYSLSPIATPPDSGGLADADNLVNGSFYANPGWYNNPLNGLGDVVIFQWGDTQFTSADLDPYHRMYLRTFNQGEGWGAWQILNTTRELETTVNLNDAQFQATGVYQIGAAGNLNVPNDPTFNDNNLVLEVFAAGGQVMQRLTSVYSYGEFYIRSLNDQGGTSWKPWFKFQGTQV